MQDFAAARVTEEQEPSTMQSRFADDQTPHDHIRPNQSSISQVKQSVTDDIDNQQSLSIGLGPT